MKYKLHIILNWIRKADLFLVILDETTSKESYYDAKFKTILDVLEPYNYFSIRKVKL